MPAPPSVTVSGPVSAGPAGRFRDVRTVSRCGAGTRGSPASYSRRGRGCHSTHGSYLPTTAPILVRQFIALNGIQTDHGEPDSLRTYVAPQCTAYPTPVGHSCTGTCNVLRSLNARWGSEKVADEQDDDLKEEANLSFRANAADLASMLAIGEHIADLTRNIDPDSSVTTTTSRAGIIRYAIRQVGHLVRTPAGRRVLTYAGRKELRMYRRSQTAFGGAWHWVETCSGWPTTNFLEQLDRPPGEALCPTCRILESETAT